MFIKNKQSAEVRNLLGFLRYQLLEINNMKVRLEVGTLGIITGEQKRHLENYVDRLVFRQRKNYDEFYIDVTNFESSLDLRQLMRLSESFTIRLLEDCVIISENK